MFERRMGSRKFGSFALFVFTFSAAGHAFSRYLLGPALASSSGPFGLIFACLVQFLSTVPVVETFEFLGLPLTDKTLVLFNGLTVMFSSGLSSFIPSAIGLLAGLFYHCDIFYVRRCLIPRPVCAFLSRTVGVLLGAAKGPTVRLPAASRATHAVRGGQVPGDGGEARGDARVEPPSEAAIAQLAEMGFTREQAARALQSTGNNIDNALAMLLGN